MPKLKETLAQTIKRLQHELEQEKMKNIIFSGMVDIMDNEYGAGLQKKVFIRTLWKAKEAKKVRLTSACRALGMPPRGVYQAIKRIKERAYTLKPIIDMVMYWRTYMPQIETRKQYQLIKPELNELSNEMKTADGYDCYQNALAERINGILKQEFLLYKCRDIDELKQLVDESISIYDNMRPHFSLTMQTPNQAHEKGQVLCT